MTVAVLKWSPMMELPMKWFEGKISIRNLSKKFNENSFFRLCTSQLDINLFMVDVRFFKQKFEAFVQQSC